MSRAGRRQGHRRRCSYCGARCWNRVCSFHADLLRLDPWIDPAWLTFEQPRGELVPVSGSRPTR